MNETDGINYILLEIALPYRNRVSRGPSVMYNSNMSLDKSPLRSGRAKSALWLSYGLWLSSGLRLSYGLWLTYTFLMWLWAPALLTRFL